MTAADPAAIPLTNLPVMKTTAPCAPALRNPPSPNMRAVQTRTFLRPRAFIPGVAIREPNRPPIARILEARPR